MANIQEKIKGKKIVSFKIKVCVGRDENGKQVFRCTTWYPPEGLTNGKARKEVQKVAIVWEDQANEAYRKELAEGKTVVAGLSRSFEFEKFVYEVWVPLCVRDGSAKQFTDTPMWNSTLSDRIGPMTKVDRSNPNYVWYSPVEAESFEGLPPAYIETAEFDCLHDDGILYADLLQKAGIEVTVNETKGTMHGFDIAAKAPTTLAAMEQRIAFMKRMI